MRYISCTYAANVSQSYIFPTTGISYSDATDHDVHSTKGSIERSQNGNGFDRVNWMLGGASLRNCHRGVKGQITGGNRSVTVSNNVYVT